MGVIRTRFAPSPTYYLHLGHAASSLHVWRYAKEHGAEVWLRIEDIDTTRCRPEYTKAILEDLAWLGLEWSEPVRVQSEHFSDYQNVVSALTARGLTYRCFRTRTELAGVQHAQQPGPHAPEEETKRLADGDPFAWRLSIAACRDALGAAWDDLSYTLDTGQGLEQRLAKPESEGDIVLARKDSPSAYHVAATYDDELQGMTHIVRGEDLVSAPHVQTLLQVLMGWRQPIYHHHPLVLDDAGQKLSKRRKSLTLAHLREQGVTPQQIRTELGFA